MTRRALFAALIALSTMSAGAAAAQPEEETFTVLSRVEEVPIDEPSTTVQLPLARSRPSAERLRQVLAEPASWNRTELVLDGIRLDTPPGVSFDLYLNTPGREADRQYVGTLSFRDEPESSRTFEVTLKLKKLRDENSELSDLQLVFEASLGTQDPTLTFDDARKQFNREAGLRIGSIQLRIRNE